MKLEEEANKIYEQKIKYIVMSHPKEKTRGTYKQNIWKSKSLYVYKM